MTKKVLNPNLKIIKDSSVVTNLKSISNHNNYDETHISTFGYLYTLKPTKTPITGLMCSLPGLTYLQIIPIQNPGITFIQNDSVENMYYEIQFYFGKFKTSILITRSRRRL